MTMDLHELMAAFEQIEDSTVVKAYKEMAKYIDHELLALCPFLDRYPSYMEYLRKYEDAAIGLNEEPDHKAIDYFYVFIIIFPNILSYS